MLKLYKNEGDAISYWETWDKNAKTGLVHWGTVGDKGQSKQVESSLFKSFRKIIQSEIDERIKDGYNTVDIDNHYTLLIEYVVDGMGTPEDVEKRTRLQDKMDEVLGWTGLGHCDGGSIGSGTMEVCCYVIDFVTAKRVIEDALVATEFDNYTRIYDENDTDMD
jgi:hypothetical protein